MTMNIMEYEEIKHRAMDDACIAEGSDLRYYDINDNTESTDRWVFAEMKTIPFRFDVYNFWYNWTTDYLDNMDWEGE